MKTIGELKTKCRRLKRTALTLLLFDFLAYLVMEILELLYSVKVEMRITILFLFEVSITLFLIIGMVVILVYDLKKLLLLGPICYSVLSLLYLCYFMIIELKYIKADEDEEATNAQKTEDYFKNGIFYYIISMDIFRMIAEISIVIVSMLYRKYYLSLAKRINNEQNESLLTVNKNASSNVCETSSFMIVESENPHKSDIFRRNDFTIHDERKYTKTANKNNIQKIRIAHMKSLDDSPELISSTINDKFETPKRGKTLLLM